ncbi:P-loop containing nucleoside triphosphate hydrolase protein [Kalaharituber pfeilii]|nr:P-loop containing nucleoside triphosphate hydrolase protein [Kalaharituber pfeilii]
MATTVLGKRLRHATDFAVKVQKQTTPNAPASRKTRHTFSAGDEVDFELAVSGALETLAEGRPTKISSAKKQKCSHVINEPYSPAGSENHAFGFASPTKKPSGVENIPPVLRTPRHRDGIKKQQQPMTPRHRVSIVGKPMTPRSAPGTPSSRGDSVPSVLGAAKAMFARGATPGKLVGREEEREKLAKYLGRRIAKGQGGCLYISGPPGTGKSAMLNETLSEIEGKVNKAYINCMVVKDPKGIYKRLLEEFWAEEMGDVESKDGMEELETLFLRSQGKRNSEVCVVVLDEIDHLLTKDQEILYSIFEWSLAKSSRLILIGIANALDFTDRFLPRLKTRNLKPELLQFQPYSAPQITSVITSRLQSLLPEDAPDRNYVPYIHPAAIQLCARKVAAHTGDLRKAFDVCRRALELLDSELKEKARKEMAASLDTSQIAMTPLAAAVGRIPLGESKVSMNIVNQAKSTVPYNLLTGPRVTIAHIARVSSVAFGGSAVFRVKTLNLQQKAVLCACCVLESRTGSAPTIRELFCAYSGLCKRDRLLAALTNTEFRDVVSGLESAGVVGMSVVGGVGAPRTPSKKGRGGSVGATAGLDERRVSCLVREGELKQAVTEVGPILTRIFTDQ